jgi:hypothetical protein
VRCNRAGRGFNPATHAEQWLIRAPAKVTGAAIAIPFYSRQDGNL